MSIYLETNALRKLTDYSCSEYVYTSIFAIFELLSDMTENDFKVRQACLKRVAKAKIKAKIKVREPMVDQLLLDILGLKDYNQQASQMITDIWNAVVCAATYSDIENWKLLVTNEKNTVEQIPAFDWLKGWDKQISLISQQLDQVFDKNDKGHVEYIKNIYTTQGIKGFSDYFRKMIWDNRFDENRMAVAEGFIGHDQMEKLRKETDATVQQYNYNLFMTAQAAIFAETYYVHGTASGTNNPSDLLHLLYLNGNDKFVSNDKIYSRIAEACPEFNFVHLDQEKSVSELFLG